MKEVFVARQPIYDLEMNIWAYELLFRDSESNNANITDNDQATYRVLVHTFAYIGLDKVTSSLPAFVNLSRNLITMKKPLPFPKGKIVVELLEDQLFDDELIDGIRRLKQQGFTVALDDFIYEKKFEPLIELIDIIKLDVLALSDAALEEHVKCLKRPHITLLAEKVETHEMFEKCKALGFKLFQGYFLSKPKIIKGKRLRLKNEELLQILSALRKQPDEEEFFKLIKPHVRFTYKLCRLVNVLKSEKASFVATLDEILETYSLQEVRRWCEIICCYNIRNKPKGLFINALERAFFLHKLCHELNVDEPYLGFELGLFSLSHAIFDMTLENFADALHLSDEFKLALTKHEGDFGKLLSAVIAYEQGNFDNLELARIDDETLSETYLKALEYAEKITGALYTRKE